MLPGRSNYPAEDPSLRWRAQNHPSSAKRSTLQSSTSPPALSGGKADPAGAVTPIRCSFSCDGEAGRARAELGPQSAGWRSLWSGFASEPVLLFHGLLGRIYSTFPIKSFVFLRKAAIQTVGDALTGGWGLGGADPEKTEKRGSVFQLGAGPGSEGVSRTR